MKFDELPKADCKGRPLEPVQNGVVKSVQLGDSDHGTLTAFLFIYTSDEHSGWGFGGYRLGIIDEGPEYPPEPGQSNLDRPGYMAQFVARCLRVVGADEWSKLVGKPVRVLSEGRGGGIIAIGHFLKDEWFCPRVEFDNVPKKLPDDKGILRTHILWALGRIGVTRIGNKEDGCRWSAGDLATDLAAELLK